MPDLATLADYQRAFGALNRGHAHGTKEKAPHKFTKPFFHLKGEGFWHLSMQPGREALLTASGSPNSFTALKASVLYAWLDDALFLLMQDALSREALRQAMLAAYFGGAARGGEGYINEVEGQCCMKCLRNTANKP